MKSISPLCLDCVTQLGNVCITRYLHEVDHVIERIPDLHHLDWSVSACHVLIYFLVEGQEQQSQTGNDRGWCEMVVPMVRTKGCFIVYSTSQRRRNQECDSIQMMHRKIRHFSLVSVSFSRSHKTSLLYRLRERGEA